MAYLREGSTREPETWVYRDRPGLPFTFTGAELRVAFDAECRFAESAGILGEDLRRAAAALVTRPDIAYNRGRDGHLVPLAAQPAARRRARARSPADAARPTSRSPPRRSSSCARRRARRYVAGLVRFPPPGAGGGARRGVSLAVQAADATGQTVASAARDSLVAPAGRRLARGVLGPLAEAGPLPGHGRRARCPRRRRARRARSTSRCPTSAGQRSPRARSSSTPTSRRRRAPRTRATPTPRCSWGRMRLRPRFGNVFAPTDSLMVVATLYGAKVDPATGQAALRSRFSILKDGKPVARGAEDAFTTPDAVASVGPDPARDLRAGSVRRPPRRDRRGGEPDAPAGSPVRDPEAVRRSRKRRGAAMRHRLAAARGRPARRAPAGLGADPPPPLPRSPSGPSPARRASRTRGSS